MTLYEFNALTDFEKAMATWAGEFAGSRFTGNKHKALYMLYEFYVEVDYDPVHNSINNFRSFKCLDHLDPYLNDIDITGLLQ